MSKNNDNRLVPKLRFIEFLNEFEWKETTLGKISAITNGKSNAQDHVENGKYPLFDRSEVIKASNTFLFDCEAVIIPGEGMKFIPKYYNGKFDLHQRAYALKNFSVDGIFVYYSMMLRSNLLAIKAVKSTVLSLRLPILQNFPIKIPKDKKEQEKIASCLWSLDEVITAESQKLEVLKEHKKGLIQNLFPQEDETVPKLRFKEFEDSGKWEVKKLGEIAKITSGGTPNRSNSEFWNGDIPWISTTLIDFNTIREANEYITEIGLQNSSAKIFPKNTILMAMYGQGKTRGKVAMLGIEAATNQACAAIILMDKHNTGFVFQYLSANYDNK